MSEIFEAVSGLINLYETTIKPGCEAALKHPIFYIFALPAALTAGIKAIKYFINRLQD